MGKNKREKRDRTLIVSSLCPAPKGLCAVFEAEDGGWEQFPVLLFAVVDIGDQGHDIRGLISAEGGLFSPEDDEAFVGYWAQHEQEIEEFLADHARGEEE